jgi:hypothetical protein
LNAVLHGSRKFAVRSAKLLKEHIAEKWVWLIDSNGVHQLFDMVIHSNRSSNGLSSEVPTTDSGSCRLQLQEGHGKIGAKCFHCE